MLSALAAVTSNLIKALSLPGMIEAMMTLAIILPLIGEPARHRKQPFRFGRTLSLVAGHSKGSILVVFILATLACLLQLAVFGIPQPIAHDEFSNLLAAETFASCRLTNPTHALWEHFETFHELQRPHYVSMYPPGQGLILAAGKRLFGNPIAGVVLCGVTLCALICWALQSIVPSQWAFVGGLIAIIKIAVLNYWTMSYWGGALAAIGGCLVLGAAVRCVKQPSWLYGITIAGGILIIANTRPYEGLFFCAGALVAAGTLVAKQHLRLRALSGAAAAGTLVLLTGLAGMGYLNWRITGNPFLRPYDLNREMYAIVPHFWWQHVASKTPIYHNEQMRAFYVAWEPVYGEVNSAAQLVGRWVLDGITNWQFYIGPALAVPFFWAFPMMRERRMGLMALPLAAIAIPVLLVRWPISPHYVAPATGCIYGVTIQGLRRLRAWRRPNQLGRRLVRALLLVVVLTVPVRFTVELHRTGSVSNPLADGPPFFRNQVTETLHLMGGHHLVFVKYSPGHDPGREWVFNHADIDASETVWARYLDGNSNSALLRYFANRKAWVLEPDTDPIFLKPYYAPGG